jgi:hypothetical protein
MNNYTISDGYLITSDPGIAALVLGKQIYAGAFLSHVVNDFLGIGFLCTSTHDDEVDRFESIRIPLSLVKEIIKPVEGEAYFLIHNAYAPNSFPVYQVNYSPESKFLSGHEPWAANTITLSKTVGELRELIAATEGVC